MGSDEKYEQWVNSYIEAWNSNKPQDIADLFTPHARYFTEPYAAPWIGQEQIVEKWLEAKDEPGDTTFDFEVISAAPDLGIVKGRTVYKTAGKTYSNLWEIRLGHADRCREFVEWWMEEKGDNA
jgi:uncharacterized protein (TIGR02246 family)